MINCSHCFPTFCIHLKKLHQVNPDSNHFQSLDFFSENKWSQWCIEEKRFPPTSKLSELKSAKFFCIPLLNLSLVSFLGDMGGIRDSRIEINPKLSHLGTHTNLVIAPRPLSIFDSTIFLEFVLHYDRGRHY